MPEQPAQILLVEDDPSDIELTLHALKKNHVADHIDVVRDGAEAIDYLFREGAAPAPRLIILDLKLPRVDGLEVLQKIKTDTRTRAIPVVALTSSREYRDIAKCYNLGVNSYIVKPVDFEQFAEAIRNLGLYWLSLNEAPR